MDTDELQEKVFELEVIRGFSHETEYEKLECFKEESREFIEAVDGNGDVAEEGVDVISTVLMVFRIRGIDLKTAFLNKYKKDKMRV